MACASKWRRAIRSRNGASPSVPVRTTRRAVVGRVFNLRPILIGPPTSVQKPPRRVTNPLQVENPPHNTPAHPFLWRTLSRVGSMPRGAAMVGPSTGTAPLQLITRRRRSGRPKDRHALRSAPRTLRHDGRPRRHSAAAVRNRTFGPGNAVPPPRALTFRTPRVADVNSL